MSKKHRRANGEGTIFKRKDGRWCGRIKLGTDEKGEPILKETNKKNKKDVVEKIQEWRLLYSQGYNNLSNTTLKEYILTWLKNTKQNKLKPLSYDRLESTINNHVIENIGHYKLDELNGPIIQTELINKMMNQKLSYSSIKKAYNAINACLKYATKNRQILSNPVETVELPSEKIFEKEEIEIFTEDEQKRFENTCILKYRNGNYVYKNGYGFIFMLYTGIRMAEALALKWSDINMNNKTVHIKRSMVLIKNRESKQPKYILVEQNTTKTSKSNRIIKLSKKAINAITELNKIYNYSDNDYIFQTKHKKPIRPRNLQNTLDYILKKANINHKGLHVLRHTFASMLFKKGVDIKTVSELLGHEEVRVTYNTYIHLIQEQKNQAIDLLDE